MITLSTKRLLTMPYKSKELKKASGAWASKYYFGPNSFRISSSFLQGCRLIHRSVVRPPLSLTRAPITQHSLRSSTPYHCIIRLWFSCLTLLLWTLQQTAHVHSYEYINRPRHQAYCRILRIAMLWSIWRAQCTGFTHGTSPLTVFLYGNGLPGAPCLPLWFMAAMYDTRPSPSLYYFRPTTKIYPISYWCFSMLLSRGR